MLRKRIKAKAVAFVLICALPSVSYAVSTDDFLKYLINSSYPEVKSEDTDEKTQDEEAKDNNDSSQSKENEKEDEYIKFHIGEENVPNIETSSEKDNKDSEKSVESSGSLYENNLRITKEDPTMLIYHTHGCETYSDNPDGNYHAQDYKNSVLKVGELLTTELEDLGWGVVHSTKYNDLNYNESYTNSLAHAKGLLAENKDVDIVIDLHRDATNLKTDEAKKKAEDRYITTIDGEEVAKFFFVVGPNNDNFDNLKKIADDITAMAEKKYPGITLPVVVKDYGRFNQYIAPNSMLLEIGSNATTSKQAQATTKYIAPILDEYFKDHK